MSTAKSKALHVEEIMLRPGAFAVLSDKALLKEALEEMGNYRLGIACIVNAESKLIGVLTDGDIRRKLLEIQKPFSAFFVDDALKHAFTTPTTIQPSATLLTGVELMGRKQIWDLPVVDASGRLLGLLHLHPAIRAVL